MGYTTLRGPWRTVPGAWGPGSGRAPVAAPRKPRMEAGWCPGHGGSGGACVVLTLGLVPPGAGDRGGQVMWGHCDGDRAACAFFCRAAAAAAGRGEADPGG